MDSQTNVQKRKRADTTEDTTAIQVPGESLVENPNSDDYRIIYRPRSIEEDSDVDQPL